MDFFEMNFSELFCKKHGKEIFESIVKQITEEKSKNCNNEYIEKIFKFTFLEHIGLKDNEIKKLLEDILKCEVDVLEIRDIHKSSICEIKKYLQDSMNEIIADNL